MSSKFARPSFYELDNKQFLVIASSPWTTIETIKYQLMKTDMYTIPTQSAKNHCNSFREPLNSLITSNGSLQPLYHLDMYLYKTL